MGADKSHKVPVEAYLARTQAELYRSRDELTFPVHVMPCLSCEENGVQVIFALDTSGSMRPEGEAICTQIDAVVSALADEGINLSYEVLGITDQNLFGFSCVSESVAGKLGSAVPGRPNACGPTLNHLESWASAAAVVAKEYPWAPGYGRVVIPVSDEGPCRGNPPCDGADREAVENAIQVATAAGTVVSPMLGDGASECATRHAAALANGTGGSVFPFDQATGDVVDDIAGLVKQACGHLGADRGYTDGMAPTTK